MKLTNKDKVYLHSIGVSDDDFKQMEYAARYTRCEMFDLADESIVTKITHKKAIELLGREKFLSGLHRSVFHNSAVRYTPDDKTAICFDSSKYFK